MTRLIKSLMIFVCVIVPLLYWNVSQNQTAYSEIKETLMPVEEQNTNRSEGITSATKIETLDSNSNEILDEYYVAPPKIRKIIRSEIGYIDDVNAFLEMHKDSLSNLPLNQKVSLQRSLQRCGWLKKSSYTEQEISEQYFSVRSVKKLCMDVNEELILQSYAALENLVNENPILVASTFYSASLPVSLSASMNSTTPPSNIKELRRKHLETSLPMLIDSSIKGNLDATLMLAIQYASTDKGIDPSPVKSLAYFMAYNSVIDSNHVGNSIRSKGDMLYPREVALAKQHAKKIIDAWNKQKYLIY